MFGNDKNLKDLSLGQSIALKDTPLPISYTKTNKLITALYIVTDILDKDEPIRLQLRTLGVEILSDITSSPRLNLTSKIQEIISFLGIASAIGLISEMNENILKKEFIELGESVKDHEKDYVKQYKGEIAPTWLEEFLLNPASEADEATDSPRSSFSIHKGHPVNDFQNNSHKRTRIGVQKGSTLMKALSDKTSSLSDRKPGRKTDDDFEILKKQRREDIINIIKKKGGSATITDIKESAQAMPLSPGSLASSGEKTIQRELVSMIKDGVLDKTGEKRWSRYFLKTP